MIESKADLREYIQKDKNANLGSISFLNYYLLKLYMNDSMMAFSYMKSLRKYEYAINSCKGIFGVIRREYRRWMWHKACIRYNISIGPNMIGPGFRIPHVIGGGLIINCKSMGSNCGANTNVLVGNKDAVDAKPTIGDNVKLSTGCMIIGEISIGNNVIVAPNAVVTKSVPSNCIVAGVPAKIIKYLDPND